MLPSATAISVAAVLILSVSAYAKDWQTGNIETHPTVVKDMFADYKGHLYRESQLGYTCMDGDADNAPVCISDEHSLVVVKPGYATIALADGAQFIVPDYTQAGLVYNPSLTVEDDVGCRLGCTTASVIVSRDYECTIFKRLSFKLSSEPNFVIESVGPSPVCGSCDVKPVTFLYRLGKLRNGVQEITIKDVGKGSYSVLSPQTPSLPEAVKQSPAANPGHPVASPGVIGSPKGNGAVAQDGASRRKFTETVLESFVKNHSGSLTPGLNVTADGPDATIYVMHGVGVTYAICHDSLTTAGFASNLRNLGFTQFACTDDRNTRFTFDLITQ
jgi:hypothetical protein